MFDKLAQTIGGTDIPEYLPTILITVAAAIGFLSLVSLIAANRPRMKELEEWRDTPPLIFKLFKPFVLLLSNDVKRLMGDVSYSRLLKKLSAAGVNYAIMPEEFLTLKIVCFIISSTVSFSIYTSDPTLGPEALVVLVFVVALGFFYPDIWLSDKVGVRRRMVAKDFPFLLDLLVLSMRAGLNYSSSLAQAIASLPVGPVREEFSKLLREIRAGKARREALLDLAIRMDIPSVHNFVAAMNQAEETGGEIVDVLTAQAEQRRNERFNAAEEAANKAPVRMLIPMMAFLFPIIFMLMAFVLIVKLAEIDALPQGMLELLMS